MALALGLGSMFNHSSTPNVGFQRDIDNGLIRYSTLREIQVGEELCISYGPNLWFPDVEESQDKNNSSGGGTTEGDVSDIEDETAESFFSRIQLSDDDDYDHSN